MEPFVVYIWWAEAVRSIAEEVSGVTIDQVRQMVKLFNLIRAFIILVL